MARTVKEGDLLWRPSEEFQQASELHRYQLWLESHVGLKFDDYAKLWEWSVTHRDDFWLSMVDFFKVPMGGERTPVLSTPQMPGAKWFPKSTINYLAPLDSQWPREGAAIVDYSEARGVRTLSWRELNRAISKCRNALLSAGVDAGDRVTAFVPNISEAVVAFLASASLGAIWSSTSPDFGSQSVIDRFRQIDPKVLIAVDGYRYGGKDIDRLEEVQEIARSLPSVRKVVLLPHLNPTAHLASATRWDDFLGDSTPTSLKWEPLPFDHPLWILYSSGTTGLPKPIVQSHGGIVLEHLKALSLHLDIRPGDRFLWWTTTGWMMWNFLVGGLLRGSTIVLHDGNPGFPEIGSLWDFAGKHRVTVLGSGAAYHAACMKAGDRPRERNEFRSLKAVGSTGSPLPPEAFGWLYDDVKQDLWVVSLSGGTDLCTAFIGGSPYLPVYAGELQCRSLGAPVYAFDEAGQEVVDQVGELVITAPMPSMPIYFWGDPEYLRYRASYFEDYPGVWRHGDWIKITSRGSAIIYGRSDATLKKKGVRMGTAEIYRAVEMIPQVVDSLVIGLDLPDGEYFMPLLVVLQDGVSLTPELKRAINEKIRTELSSRHVPDDIISVRALPRTLSGKKLEVPIRRVLSGAPPEKAVNLGSIRDPSSVFEVVEAVRKRLPSGIH